VRVALITVGEAAGDTTGPGLLAGRTLARHQLEFALAFGCKKVILFGHGASAEAIDLRHAAEGGGAQVQVVRGVRDLPAAVRGDDRLLVLAHGLLTDSEAAFKQLGQGDGVLVLPAEAGWSAGFERLDLAAAWGGAMVLPGRLVAGLDQLPEDAEPISGLLRLARQGGVPERPLPERELAEGRWQIVRTPGAAHAVEPAWLRRRLPPTSPFRPTAWLARWLTRRVAAPWIGSRWVSVGLAASAVVLLAGGVAVAWSALAVVAFALLVPAALAIEASDALRLLGRSIFDSETRSSRLSFTLHIIFDLMLLVLGPLTIDGSRVHRLFAPLVVVGLLHVPPPAPEAGWHALAADRGLLAVLLAAAAAFGLSEAGFMVLALALIALRLAPSASQHG
jgi:hypothetical protein